MKLSHEPGKRCHCFNYSKKGFICTSPFCKAPLLEDLHTVALINNVPWRRDGTELGPFQVTTALNLWYIHLVLIKVITLEHPSGHTIKIEVLGNLSSLMATPTCLSPPSLSLSHPALYRPADLCHLLAPTVDQACLTWHFVNSCWPHKAFQQFPPKTRSRPRMTRGSLTNYDVTIWNS